MLVDLNGHQRKEGCEASFHDMQVKYARPNISLGTSKFMWLDLNAISL